MRGAGSRDQKRHAGVLADRLEGITLAGKPSDPGREMRHDLRLVPLDQLLGDARLAQVAVAPTAGDHLVTAAAKLLGQIAADEAGSAGDQDAHAPSSHAAASKRLTVL